MPSQDEVNNFQAIIGRLAALAGDTAADIMREIGRRGPCRCLCGGGGSAPQRVVADHRRMV